MFLALSSLVVASLCDVHVSIRLMHVSTCLCADSDLLNETNARRQVLGHMPSQLRPPALAEEHGGGGTITGPIAAARPDAYREHPACLLANFRRRTE